MNRIAELRKEKGMNQIALAMRLNISQKMISAYENGKNEPSIATLKQLADIFGVSIDYLLGYTDIKQQIDKINTQIISDNENTLLSEYRKLSQNQKYVALGVIIGIRTNSDINNI